MTLENPKCGQNQIQDGHREHRKFAFLANVGSNWPIYMYHIWHVGKLLRIVCEYEVFPVDSYFLLS